MSENYNNLPKPEKSRYLMEEEKEAIEHWRKEYPELSDEELLAIEENWQRYIQLTTEIATRLDREEKKKKEPKK